MLLTSTSVSVTVRCFEVLELKTLRDSSCILQRCDLAVAAVGGFVHNGHGGVMFLNFQILVHVKVCRLCVAHLGAMCQSEVCGPHHVCFAFGMSGACSFSAGFRSVVAPPLQPPMTHWMKSDAANTC